MEIPLTKLLSILVFLTGVVLNPGLGDEVTLTSETADLPITTNKPEQSCPRNLTVVLHRANSLTLEWEEPSDWLGKGLGYVIWVNDNPVRLNGIENRHFKSSNLKSSTNYNVSLVAVSEIDEQEVLSQPVTLVALTNTFDEPTPPRNFRIQSQKPGMAKLVWDSPREWNAPDGGYEILTEDGLKVTLTKGVTYFEPTRLKTGVLYTYLLVAFNQMDGVIKTSEPVRLEIMQRPKPASNLKVGYVSSTSIDLSWDEPEDEKVDGYFVYHVAANVVGDDVVTGDTSVTIKNIRPWTYVYISLASFIKVQGRRALSENVTTTVRTDSAEPSRPESISVLNVTANEVLLEWEPPEAPNGPLTGYIVSWTSGKETQNLTTIKTQKAVDGLCPWTRYSFEVKAYNSIERRTQLGRSRAVSIQTLVAAPGEMRQPTLTEGQNRSLTVQWEKPEKPNGPVHRYIAVLNSTGAEWKVDTDWLNFTFTNLRPWTQNTLSLTAYNVLNGQKLCGPEIYTSFRTPMLAPSVCTDLKIKSVTNTTVELNWYHPDEPNGPISGYHVTWGDTSVTTNETTYTARNLKPWTEYNFTVNAFNENGTSELVGPDAEIQARTAATAPPDPAKRITIIRTEQSSAVVYIPTDTFSGENGPVVEYMLLVTFNSSEDMWPGRGYDGANDTEFPSWDEGKDKGVWYRSTPERWDFTKDKTICEGGENNMRRCELGRQKTCGNLTFCDGPLKQNTEYWTKLRGYTDSGWSETPPVSFRTQNVSSRPALGIALSLLIILVKLIL